MVGPSLVWVQYPLVPWIGVMAAGYAFGALYELEAGRRIRIVVRLGLSLTGAFVIIRALNIYGDPSHWSVQPSALLTSFSFINTTKYPPSLLYLLMTLGPALVALALFERGAGSAAPPLPWRSGPAAAFIIFGRVPFFFYLWQWVLAHTAAIVANIIAGRSFAYLLLMQPALFNVRGAMDSVCGSSTSAGRASSRWNTRYASGLPA